MPHTKTIIFQTGSHLEFVEIPATHAYQLTALNKRLHKELDKLTAAEIPALGKVLAECDNVEVVDEAAAANVENALQYITKLEQSFSGIKESRYPLISLLTEIRALQAQLEQWYEEESESLA